MEICAWGVEQSADSQLRFSLFLSHVEKRSYGGEENTSSIISSTKTPASILQSSREPRPSVSSGFTNVSNGFILMPEHADGEHANGEHADGEHADGEHADGEHADGELADGEHADGEHADGEHADGEHADGELVDGEHADGELVAGELVDGELADGEHADGEHVDGEHADGELVDGELVAGELVDGELADGEHADGELVDGELADGEHADGEHADGELADGEHADGEHADGEHADGELVDGEHADGEHADGEHVDGEHVDGELVDGEHADGELVDGLGEGATLDGAGRRYFKTILNLEEAVYFSIVKHLTVFTHSVFALPSGDFQTLLVILSDTTDGRVRDAVQGKLREARVMSSREDSTKTKPSAIVYPPAPSVQQEKEPQHSRTKQSRPSTCRRDISPTLAGLSSVSVERLIRTDTEPDAGSRGGLPLSGGGHLESHDRRAPVPQKNNTSSAPLNNRTTLFTETTVSQIGTELFDTLMKSICHLKETIDERTAMIPVLVISKINAKTSAFPPSTI
ncbi:hypothetical protein DNTS_005280 [Danionella cerebrum]|uniref:Uncharacterized protein n=1 Tax=Danionella cerebrum TaxID=2873325 RepID=A0A553R8T2_9TELE|nr:hypothetical protein DNTS_005280 [Danionella translucida]